MALDKVVDSTILDGYFSDIANAIRRKNGESGTYTPAQMPQKINDIPSGGGAVERKDVNFIDYDGTIVYSFTTAEFLALSEMPENPTHAGLTSQGWNWSLTDAHNYVDSYMKLTIGQMYITDDGKTRVYITLPEGRTEPYIGYYLSGTAVIDWGDGNTDNVTGGGVNTLKYIQHQYSNSGDYVITIDITGTFKFAGYNSSYILMKDRNTLNDNSYPGCVTKIELGSNISLANKAFRALKSLESITIPSYITSMGSDQFTGCYLLKSVTIPNGITYIGNWSFSTCYALESVSLPKGLTKIPDYMFRNCYGLKWLDIPDGVTEIYNDSFSSCCALESVTIPNNVTSFGSNVFNSASSLKSVIIPDSVSTGIGTYFFSNCVNLFSCSLSNNMTVLQNGFFNGCVSLCKITIPASITSINNSSLSACRSLAEIHFKSATPPSVANSNAFSELPSDCKIYVPTGSLSAYTSATNYPSSSTYTYIEE